MAVINNYLRVEKGELRPKDEKRLKAFLTFCPKEDTEVWVYRRKASTGELWLPRGIKDLAPDYLSVRDKRSFPKLPKYETTIELDYKDKHKQFIGQAQCVEAMRSRQQGTIHRQPGTGKTQIALYFAATVGTRTLVLVHTEDILQQWLDYAAIGIPDMPVGIIRGKKYDVQQLTIATVQTMYQRHYPAEFWRQFGCTILDECHHGAARTFEAVISKATSRYLFGFSASTKRADNMQPLVRYYFGPVIHEQTFAAPMPVTVEKIRTKYKSSSGPMNQGPMWLKRKRWHGMIKGLATDPRRNKQISNWTAKKLDEGRSTLVLSRRIEQLELVAANLEARGYEPVILAAKLMPKAERRKMVAAFRAGDIKCVLATQLADEALDVPRLSAVALAYPGKHTDLLLQQVGRALREHPDKVDAVIGDFVDKNVKSLNSMWHGRRRFYLKAGFKIKGAGIRGRMNRRTKLLRRAVVTARIK